MARAPTSRPTPRQLPKVTPEKREQRRQRRLALATDIADAKKVYAQAAIDIARKHGRTVRWAQTQLFMKDKFVRLTRRVNPWNAFLKAKLNEVNAGRKEGERFKLTTYVANNKATLQDAYRQLGAAQQQAYTKEVQVAREKQTAETRGNPRAVSNTVTAAFATMDHEWTSLCATTGIEGFYVAVRGTINDFSAPKIFFSEKAEKFIKVVLDLDPQRLALKFESWVVSGMDAPAMNKTPRPLNKLVSECRTLIQDELEYILSQKKVRGKVKMNYDNYERHIVEKYSVTLTGWPLNGPVKNPGKLGRADLERLRQALVAETCEWTTLNASQLAARIADNKARHARGEFVYKIRKPRGVTSNDTVDTSSDSGEDE